MLVIHLLILLGAIFLGARYGSIAIGMAGGFGVAALGLTGVPVTQDDIPFDVIGIIVCVIAAISAMQRAGGLDYVVDVAERWLRKNPRRITLYAPIVTWLMTIAAGTGHTAYSTMPVIVEVAKEGNVRPSKPLSVAVVSSQMAIVASPISAAVVFMASALEPFGISYLTLLAIMIPATFLAIFPTAFLVGRYGGPLDEFPEYQRRLDHGLVDPPHGRRQRDIPAGAKATVAIFLTAIVLVVVYAVAISEQAGLVTDPTLPRNEAIMTIMLAAATLMVIIAKIPAGEVITTQVFRSGMSAAVCVLGVAWLGTTFINHYLEMIEDTAGTVLSAQPWLLSLILAGAACLLYSQAATAKALIPAALGLGVSPLTAIAAFPAVSALFVLPTYPTLLAAVEMDDTGSTRIGKLVFNHSFLLPGVANIAMSIIIAYGLGALLT